MGAFGSTLSFQDEFLPLSGSPADSQGLDRSKWTNALRYETSKPSDPVNYAVRASGSVGSANGVLKVWPMPTASGQFINRTFDTDPANAANTPYRPWAGFQQRYGFFEARAKLLKGVGPRPAFWLFNHLDDAPGSRRPEIDIMEAYPGSKTTAWANTRTHEALRHETSVWGSDGTRLGSQFNPTDLNDKGVWPDGATQWPYLDQAFNVFGCWWDANVVNFYFNGKLVYAVNHNDLMTEPMYIVLDLWFGSGSGRPSKTNTPTGETNAYEIDYVRAWPSATG